MTAGASTPEFLVTEVVEALQRAEACRPVREVHVVEEDVRFGLPREPRTSPAGLARPCRRAVAPRWGSSHALRHVPARQRRAQARRGLE